MLVRNNFIPFKAAPSKDEGARFIVITTGGSITIKGPSDCVGVPELAEWIKVSLEIVGMFSGLDSLNDMLEGSGGI